MLQVKVPIIFFGILVFFGTQGWTLVDSQKATIRKDD